MEKTPTKFATKWLYVAILFSLQCLVLFVTKPDLLTIIGSLAGVLCVTTLVFKDYKTFIFGGVSNIVFLILGLQHGIYSEIIQQPMFFILGMIGLSAWRFNHQSKFVTYLAKTNLKTVLPVTGVLIILWTIISYSLGSSVYIYDGLLGGIALAAQALEIGKNKYSWVGWALLNILSIIAWYKVGNPTMAFMYAIYLLNSLHGFVRYSLK